MVKKVALLGATGSIGTSFFEVFREQKDRLQLSFVAAHQNFQKLCTLAMEYGIQSVALTGITDIAQQKHIRQSFPQLKLYFGESELIRLLGNEDYDIGLNAIGGSSGIGATFAILKHGKKLALANKESLVMGGHLVQKLKQPGQIIPVDSEHSAIFQALGQHPLSEVKKLIITASGGAFRSLPLDEFTSITPAMALKHPNWDMGAKVTLDSATMFNKALEVMEAHWLFDLPYARIEAVIHPQSVIHSLVQFIDGSLLAQLSSPDMKLPILYALSYPDRWSSVLVQTDLLTHKDLSFQALESSRYPLYYLGLEVAQAGGILPTIMNAAVEAAMQLFLIEKIRFIDIHPLVESAMQDARQIPSPDLETIVACNKDTYTKVLAKYT
ncbi:MAG: 1-deoxy-D-xylulose-5-phosphate reductoisomerase [Candidatus Cloacimonadaceae bacterium]|jgi:1-deoxy-D-xylulose-5-phosphate reductoisomerase|nr:1-deoxy-D-xylulose-5-phosphate reductoisomerase [Candidatus Cloacimonadota bacterium]MDY0126976.1 1-deoxy-D-xylulose-5-phosphate reductoisomerase [Candidatus Cloacimonadaceae bacterium]MCB5255508.1 1-deoxy-D-xylulose-5-phosphate reductoisomerase [Candidatus Cloacimonadota bacterium]MCK9179161.1 1-deoxy-D-xylulose-5-phosphate reductoisomerase [Candidatus Cloacimonadota bacterium]MCK9243507.1 1-deoxy-D-xylulose-5-phosphate reductoisomerase [Candidatus Cloacimonadota bacterium]